MKRICPDSECLSRNEGPDSGRVIRRGSYWRKSDGQRIPRFWCRACSKSFSSARFFPCYRQKRRKLNHPVFMLLDSGVTQRRASLILGANRKTVVRKFRFMAEQSRLAQEKYLKELESKPVIAVQFDDLET